MTIESIQIQYIIYNPEQNQNILQIGGTHPNGVPWKISLTRAIRAIEANEWKFHININEAYKEVVIIKVRGGYKSLGVLMNKDPEVIVPLSQVAIIPKHFV